MPFKALLKISSQKPPEDAYVMEQMSREDTK